MRHARLLLTGLLLLLVPASSATAGPITATKLSAAKAVSRTCHAQLYSRGTAGVAQRRVTVPKLGLVQARLSGPRRGDWDLAVFNRAGRAVAASAHFGNRELAEGIVGSGQRVTVQACRRSGSAKRVRLSVSNEALPRAQASDKVRLVRVLTPTDAEKDRLVATGLDLTEHGRENFIDVMIYSDRELQVLETAGFAFATLSSDVFAETRAALRGGRAGASSHEKQGSSPLPSGRQNYRRLADYSADLKLLAEKHPDLVKPITLPHLTHEGRPVEGVVITKDPGASDGKPTFLQMGVHHAREWPSGEMSIEWAFELVNEYGKNERTTRLVDSTRTIVVPLVNPDGFNLTREMPFAEENLDAGASEIPVDSGQPVVDPGFAYKRRNCRMIALNEAGSGYEPTGNACSDIAGRDHGVDPNRNYGGLWGGPGATHDPTSDTFYGPGPFSEPETQNVRWLVSNNQVTTLITNHTYSDLILRPPGIAAQGDTVDEDAYEALGQDMADQNGYSNWQSFLLYDTSGTTEDWSYYATGGFGFTFEIGRAAQSVLPKSGEPNSQLVLDIAGSYAGVGFHPPYPLGVVAEWSGKGPWTGKGNKEAYYQALEATADTAKHSVIRGQAAPGTKLTLSKTFMTVTSPRGANEDGLAVFMPDGQPVLFEDRLSTSMTVPDSGQFEWHVNPSTRPAVAKGIPPRTARGPRTADFTIAHDPEATFVPGFRQSPAPPAPGTYEERTFKILETEDNGAVSVAIQWPGDGSVTPAGDVSDEDLDLYLEHKNDAGVYEQVASSGSSSGNSEQLTLPNPLPGDYRILVVNWFAPSEENWNWTGSVRFADPATSAGIPPATEAWTLSCQTPDGRSSSEAIVVGRGQAADAVVSGCRAPGATSLPAGAKPTPSKGAPAGAVQGQKRAADQRQAAAKRKAAARKRRAAHRRCLRKARTLRSAPRRKRAIRRCNARYAPKGRVAPRR